MIFGINLGSVLNKQLQAVDVAAFGGTHQRSASCLRSKTMSADKEQRSPLATDTVDTNGSICAVFQKSWYALHKNRQH